jgi:LmbE family N-acetylglucosaminyl deacetylase
MGLVRAEDNQLALATGMHKLGFCDAESGIRNILCLGAHCDDIEIGCGGTILRLMQENPKLNFHWVVFSSSPRRKREALAAARLFLGTAVRSRVVIRNFRDSFFPHEWKGLKEFFESIRKRFQPDLIFTHYRSDLHQDHRVISDLTWNAFRDHFVLEYEIPKYDGDLGSPNFFVDLDEAVCARKIHNITASFRSQAGKQWFTEDTFRALLRIRGVESNAEGRYAEGFYCRKALV